jgi:hypothetical protein
MPRSLIDPHKGDKRYMRRKSGKFTSKQVNVARSLAADRRSKSKHVVKKGEGDRATRSEPEVTNFARLPTWETALAMVFKLAEAAEKGWRRLDGHNQLPKVILGAA